MTLPKVMIRLFRPRQRRKPIREIHFRQSDVRYVDLGQVHMLGCLLHRARGLFVLSSQLTVASIRSSYNEFHQGLDNFHRSSNQLVVSCY